jgi:2-oxoglutarate dehydrogenase E2 component (dihydrolipoamide succinyltransferase)
VTYLNNGTFKPALLVTVETVKVPQMAESISEGTLRSWSKQVGDSVEADEEVATIETDKVSGTLLASLSYEQAH